LIFNIFYFGKSFANPASNQKNNMEEAKGIFWVFNGFVICNN